jgi:hypothetical protein
MLAVANMVRAWLIASVLGLVAAPALADCIDINGRQRRMGSARGG